MNKKMTIAGVVVLAMAFGAFARPYGPGFRHCGPGPGFHHGFGHRYHGGFWGRGGCHFWPGFVGGIVGSAVYDAVTYPRYASSVVVTPAPAPVVVQQPVVVQRLGRRALCGPGASQRHGDPRLAARALRAEHCRRAVTQCPFRRTSCWRTTSGRSAAS